MKEVLRKSSLGRYPRVMDRPPPITDARRMRAVSHPLRMVLLDLLAEGERTATQCAEVTGESPASCSFHLRTLAKYGFIEPAERRGRERPWRLVEHTRDFRPDFDDPASMRAMGELARQAIDHAVTHVHRWLDVAAGEPEEWIDASTISTTGVWLTLDELRVVSEMLQSIVEQYRGRTADPSLRPPGARPVRILSAAAADPHWEAREHAFGHEQPS